MFNISSICSHTKVRLDNKTISIEEIDILTNKDIFQEHNTLFVLTVKLYSNLETQSAEQTPRN